MPILADAGIPMIVLQMPAMVCALVPVILVEGLLVRHWLPLSYKDAFRGTAVANLVSTIVGVPLAWLFMFAMELGILIPVATAADHWHWQMDSPVCRVLEFLVSVAWLGPDEKHLYWMIPAALALLLIPSFMVSVWIERRIGRRHWPHLDVASVRSAVFKANLASYALLFLLACSWLAIEMTTKQ